MHSQAIVNYHGVGSLIILNMFAAEIDKGYGLTECPTWHIDTELSTCDRMNVFVYHKKTINKMSWFYLQ